jgi:uncharacterized protein (TIGR02145 family)
MKRLTILLAAVSISLTAFSQHYACRNDTVRLYQPSYRGTLAWQRSDNGLDWTRLPGTHKDTLAIVTTGESFYRTEVTEGSCRPYYSDIVHLIISELPPIYLEVQDSACLNEIPFIINGGTPTGGTYWGDGMVDGKFNPAYAGPGMHKLYYRYADTLSLCADTAFAYVTVVNLPNRAQAGTDMPFVASDSILLNANIPENGIGTWSILDGTHGHFSDVHSANAWFYKDSINLNFTLRWTITGKCGTSFDDVVIAFFPLSKNPCPNAPIVTDADGNVYPTIQIGNQCWMGKNLNVGRPVTSTVRFFDHADVSDNGITEKYRLNNNPDSSNLYGGLYDWYEAMAYTDIVGGQGICPDGWHIPTDAEWAILDSNYAYGDAGGELKVGGGSGFEGMYAGMRTSVGDFTSNGSAGFFWTSSSWTYGDNNEGYYRKLEGCNGWLTKDSAHKQSARSVRCIKNNQ